MEGKVLLSTNFDAFQKSPRDKIRWISSGCPVALIVGFLKNRFIVVVVVALKSWTTNAIFSARMKEEKLGKNPFFNLQPHIFTFFSHTTRMVLLLLLLRTRIGWQNPIEELIPHVSSQTLSWGSEVTLPMELCLEEARLLLEQGVSVSIHDCQRQIFCYFSPPLSLALCNVR